jgi:hypothetical protein
MDELELLDTPVMEAGSLIEMLIRFAFNFLFIWIIIHKLYFPKSQRKDYYFTFALISVSVFFLIYLLGNVKIKVGFALGLFAIFGIIRYRTESMSVREMTYLFVIIALSVINALAVTLNYVELLATNLIFIACMAIFERLPWIQHLSEKLVLYDRIELITPDRRADLIDDLNRRLGVKVAKVEVGSVDFLRDSVMLKVFYEAETEQDNTVNRIFKFPRN